MLFRKKKRGGGHDDKKICQCKLCGLNPQQKSGSINQHIRSIVSGVITNLHHECILPRLRENSGEKKVKVEKKSEGKAGSCSANVTLRQQNDARRKSGCLFF